MKLLYFWIKTRLPVIKENNEPSPFISEASRLVGLGIRKILHFSKNVCHLNLSCFGYKKLTYTYLKIIIKN